MPGDYFLRSGYLAREDVSYFDDTVVGVVHQPEIYAHTARVAGLQCERGLGRCDPRT